MKKNIKIDHLDLWRHFFKFSGLIMSQKKLLYLSAPFQKVTGPLWSPTLQFIQSCYSLYLFSSMFHVGWHSFYNLTL